MTGKEHIAMSLTPEQAASCSMLRITIDDFNAGVRHRQIGWGASMLTNIAVNRWQRAILVSSSNTPQTLIGFVEVGSNNEPSD